MRVLVIFDGSDDGFEGLQRLSGLLPAAGADKEFTLAVVGWPVRPSPIWDLAFERQAAVDDLHRAMAEVASIQLERLRGIFSRYGHVSTVYLEGDPFDQIVALTDREKPELLIGGLTRGSRARIVNETIVAILQHTAVPTFLAFGPQQVR